MGDLLGRFNCFVSWFYLDFLSRDGQSDIHRVCRSLGDPRFLVQDTGAQGLARVVLERHKCWFVFSRFASITR